MTDHRGNLSIQALNRARVEGGNEIASRSLEDAAREREADVLRRAEEREVDPLLHLVAKIAPPAEPLEVAVQMFGQDLGHGVVRCLRGALHPTVTAARSPSGFDLEEDGVHRVLVGAQEDEECLGEDDELAERRVSERTAER